MSNYSSAVSSASRQRLQHKWCTHHRESSKDLNKDLPILFDYSAVAGAATNTDPQQNHYSPTGLDHRYHPNTPTDDEDSLPASPTFVVDSRLINKSYENPAGNLKHHPSDPIAKSHKDLNQNLLTPMPLQQQFKE